MRITSGFSIASLLIAGSITGCLEKASPVADASAADVGATMRPDAAQPDAASTPSGKPLAEGCAANEECASGFCVDGVCCDSTCDQQCASCNQTGNVGYCTPQIVGDDLNAVVPCTGAHTCSIGLAVLNLPACRLKTLQGCTGNADCASLDCETFYVDHDGDGYGESSKTLGLCEVSGATPPSGYSTIGGDCCDSDLNAYPGQTKYFSAADACGSWDYDCDGTLEGATAAGISYGTVPQSECGETIHGSCSSCTTTILCR